MIYALQEDQITFGSYEFEMQTFSYTFTSVIITISTISIITYINVSFFLLKTF